jgi:tRNA 2-thiocytidine biosynthesis protein TtcA
MRRGSLSESAKKFNCNKIALAHHLDDAIESFMMGFMYNGIMRSMSPKYTTESGDIIIRPFSYVRENFIREIAKKK